jgi:integrase
MRIGELLALQVPEVNFLRRAVSVVEQLHPRDRRRMPLKTAWSARTVPLPQVAAQELARHMQVFPPVDGFLFTNERALPYQHHPYNDNVVKAAKRAGLPHTTTIKVYGHLMPNSEERTRKSIDAAWSAPEVPPAEETGS